ncbi:DUF4362 domain-containing protein [Micromonospora sp. ATA51]|uniref:DUF4362 domain-containing protein n=1 Tax=Micromonospora sp. ATA51 TaxID=2806098 RepID=UPI001A415DA6|nr:DUF4362 domain-containing protein [Micromonospora sp. ATA51]MBM0226848.1 DUF4362 domain-containing protein [Micromonospora sp. ATA51]
MRLRNLTLLSVALVLCVPTLTGCASVHPPPRTGPPPAPFVPTTHAGRQDCGAVSLGQGDTPPPASLRCFLDAVHDHTPARLLITAPTVEGDPITTSYLAGADGRVEVITDARADHYGSGRVERQTCTGPTDDQGHWLSFATCSTPEPL